MMQTTGSTPTRSPGWSKRTRLIVGVGVLVVLVAWFAVLAVDYIYPGVLSPPSQTRQAEVIGALTDQVRQEFGAELASVDIRYGRDGLAPAFFGEVRLKDLPLVFPFSARDVDLRHYPRQGPPDVAAFGGRERFISLATAFHADFPDSRTIEYQFVQSPRELPPSLRTVAERPGPTVIVSGSETVGARPQTLGVYSRNPKGGAWELVHRGGLPGDEG